MQKFSTEFRVRYAETDQMGIAHHAGFFVWFEMARSEFCRALGLPYGEWEANGVFVPVVEVSCRYKSPLLYDEPVTVEIWVSEMGTAFGTFKYRLLHADGKVAAEAWTKHAFTNAEGRLIKRGNEYIDRIRELFAPYCEEPEDKPRNRR